MSKVLQSHQHHSFTCYKSSFFIPPQHCRVCRRGGHSRGSDPGKETEMGNGDPGSGIWIWNDDPGNQIWIWNGDPESESEKDCDGGLANGNDFASGYDHPCDLRT